MSKCNIFKPLKSPGEFLMFSQYADDITKYSAMGPTYRVVPSKFVALNLDLDVFKFDPEHPEEERPKGVYPGIIAYEDGHCTMSWVDGNNTITGVDTILPQIFQSYYENAVTWCRDVVGEDPSIPDNIGITKAQLENREYTNDLLWECLMDFGLINKRTPSDNGGKTDFNYFEEVKYIGDINIHSSRSIDSYNYDEIFCYIPTEADECFYHLASDNPPTIPFYPQDEFIRGWNPQSYPTNYPLNIRGIFEGPDDSPCYTVGNLHPELEFAGDIHYSPVPRHADSDENAEFDINAIVVFYDIINSEPGDDPVYLHKGRPMGIYFTGKAEYMDDGSIKGLENTITKYVTNNDAYGQGSGFGLRIMTRYVPTPNSTTYTMEVSTDAGDYETIARAMGLIADAIVDMNRNYRQDRERLQVFKDHMAQFRNNRTNVPYVRMVNGKYYWFVNGRNTGQPVHPYMVSFDSPIHGHIEVDGEVVDGTYMESDGNWLTVKAVSLDGYVFKSWEIDDVTVSEDILYSFRPSKNVHVAAVFEVDSVEVSIAEPEHGTITVTPSNPDAVEVEFTSTYH